MRAMKAGKKIHNIQRIDIMLIIALNAILLFFCLMHIKELNQIIVINDEFGYWSIASSLAGKNWSELISNTPFYSFGYSILLVPLYYLGIPSYTIYKAAILFNALIVVSGFAISIICGRRIFPMIDKKVIFIICFLINCYPNVLVQSQIAWTESLLNFLFWSAVLIVLSIAENPKLWKIIMFFVVLGYMYYVHQRTIGIVFSGALIIILLFILKKIPMKKMLWGIIVLIILFMIHIYVKGELKSWLWSNSGLSNMNDFSNQTSLLSAVFSKVGLSSIFYGFFGRVFYFLVTGGILWYCGISHIIVDVLHTLKSSIIKIVTPVVIMEIFVLLSFLATVAIGLTSVTQGFPRADAVVYGRYIENTIGPILLIGCGVVYQRRPSIKQILSYVLLIFLSSTITTHILQIMGDSTFVDLGSVGLASFFESAGGKEAVTKALEYALILNGSVCILLYSKREKIACLSVVALFLGSWLYTGNYTYTHTIKYMQTIKIEANEPIVDLLKKANVTEIYYIKDENLDPYCSNPKYLQYWIPDITIHVIDPIDIDSIPENSVWLCEKGSKNVQEWIKGAKILKESNELFVCTQMDSQVILVLKELGESFEKFLDLSMAESEIWDAKEADFLSNGESGFLVEPYKVKLSAGTYSAKFNMELIDSNGKKNMGKCSVTKNNGKETIAEIKIDDEFLMGENNQIQFSCMDSEDIEFNVELKKGVILKLNSISYEKIADNYAVGKDSVKDIQEVINNIQNIDSKQINYISNSKDLECDFSYLNELYSDINIKAISKEDLELVSNDAYIILERKNEDIFEYLDNYDCLIYNAFYILITAKDNGIAQVWKESNHEVYTDGFIDINMLKMRTDGTICSDNIVSLNQGTYEIDLDSTNVEGNAEIYADDKTANIDLHFNKDKVQISIRNNDQTISWKINSIGGKQPEIRIKRINKKYQFDLASDEGVIIDSGEEIEIPLLEGIDMGTYDFIFTVSNIISISDLEIELYKKVDTINDNLMNMIDKNQKKNEQGEVQLKYRYSVEKGGNRQIKCIIKNKSKKQITLENIQLVNID